MAHGMDTVSLSAADFAPVKGGGSESERSVNSVQGDVQSCSVEEHRRGTAPPPHEESAPEDRANSKLLNGSFIPKFSNNALEDNIVVSNIDVAPSLALNNNSNLNKHYQRKILNSDPDIMSPLLTKSSDRSSLKLKLDEKNVSSKPKLIVRTIHENPIHGQEKNLLLDKGESRPGPHVQFHNERNSFVPPAKQPSSTLSSSISSSSSSSSSSESIDISEARPPDGGWGWVIVAVSFMVNLIADGITFSFGVIYHEFLNYFGEDKSKTAWIGSLFMAMPLLSGPIASFLTDRYGCQKVTIIGALLACVGFVLSSFANSTEMLYLTFGVFAGFGLSLCYVASVVIVAYYFDKKRSFATGLAVCGSGIGTFIFAPLIQLLLEEYGWRGTTLILAGLFLNLVVCGALMRDLPWTAYKHKSAAKERKRKRSLRRKKNDSSDTSFSVSNSTNTASCLQPIPENDQQQTGSRKEEEEDERDQEHRLFSSLVNLPTYVRNGEKVPIEVLELLSTHKNVYNVLLQNYPSLLAPSRSFSDSGRLHKADLATKTLSPLAAEAPLVPSSPSPSTADAAYLWWLKKNEITPPRMIPQKKLPAYFRDLRVHRLSLTYRGAMLNINRYRLRASSCPDIYRNSMTTIAKAKMQWYAGLWDFWDLVVDIINVSYFKNITYTLFALSNFFLYMWYDVEYMYLTDHAIGMGFSEKDGSMLISVIGIVNMFGEIMLGWLGDRPWVNASIVYAFCMCLCGAVTGIVPLFDNYVSLCFQAGSYGFFIAANYSLTCIILVEVITLERFTNAYGLLLLVQGIANLIGPPLAGWISDVTSTYDLSFFLAGIFIALSGLLLFILPAINGYKRMQSSQKKPSDDSSLSRSPPATIKCHHTIISCLTGDLERGHTITENHV